jgi:hypothetical protein
MLSAGAVRQLAWIVVKASGRDPSGLITPTSNRYRRYGYTRELEEAGLIQVTRVRGKESQYHLLNNSNLLYCGTVIEDTGVQQRIQGGVQERTPVDTSVDLQQRIPVDTTVYGYESLEDEADDIDTMPDEGRDTPAKSNTPFRTRRKVQRQFVQRAWEQLYPTQPPLIDDNANELIKFCDESAALVLELFRRFEGSSKGVFRYLRKVALNQQAERSREQSVAPTSPASGSKNFPGWDSDEAYYAHLEKMKELQQLMSENGYSDD